MFKCEVEGCGSVYGSRDELFSYSFMYWGISVSDCLIVEDDIFLMLFVGLFVFEFI